MQQPTRPAIRSGFAAALHQTQAGFPSPISADSAPEPPPATSLTDALNRASTDKTPVAAPPTSAPVDAGSSPVAPQGPPPEQAAGLPDTTGSADADVKSQLPFSDLIDDIDSGFERIVDHPGPASAPASTDVGEVRELFNQIAATHMGPVRDFVIELKLGEPPREWIDLVSPAVSSLRKSAGGMGLEDICQHLDTFLGALEVATSLGQPTLTGEAKDRLLQAHGQLAEAMPQVFFLDEERDRREPIIVQSLLRQVPEVRKVALDKLYGAGLTSLAMYYVAKPYDIAEAAGISVDLAGRIVARFNAHKREVAEVPPDAGRSREFAKLDQLSNRLREQNSAFDVAAKGWSRGAAKDKRRLRKARHETVLQINVLLARLGEVDLVDRLERMPFHTKVDALDEYLQDAKNANAQRLRAEGGQGK